MLNANQEQIRKELYAKCKSLNIKCVEFAPGHFRLFGEKRTLDYWPYSNAKMVWFQDNPNNKKGTTYHNQDVNSACIMAAGYTSKKQRNQMAVDLESRFGGIEFKTISVDEAERINSEVVFEYNMQNGDAHKVIPWAKRSVLTSMPPVPPAPKDARPWMRETVAPAEQDTPSAFDSDTDVTAILVKLHCAERSRDDFKKQMREFAAKLDTTEHRLSVAQNAVDQLVSDNAKLTEQVIAEQFDAHEAREKLKAANIEVSKANAFLAEVSEAFKKAKAKAMTE